MKQYRTAALLWGLVLVLAGCPAEPEPGGSSDATLKSLTVSAGALNPVFDPETTAYAVEVHHPVDSLTVTGVANHPGAVIGANNDRPQPLTVGLNTITLTVAAENGASRVYALAVTRDDGSLRSVTVDGALRNGTISSDTATGAPAGTRVGLTVTAAAGYHLHPLSLKYRNRATGAEIPVDPSSQSFILPAADVTILAEFIPMKDFARLFIPVQGAVVTISPLDGDSAAYPFAEAKLPATVNDFELGATEITEDLWNEVKLWAIAEARGSEKYTIIGGDTSIDLFGPVGSVRFKDAVVWCNAYGEYAKAKLGPEYADFEPLYTFNGTVLRSIQYTAEGFNSAWDALPAPDLAKKGYRLPTEAEWEFAVRGGVSDEDLSAPWNWLFAGHPNDYTAVAVTGAEARVGTKLPNTLGFYDMCGNASELLWDLWVTELHVSRGGAYSAVVPKISSRAASGATGSIPSSLGFRVVRQK